MNNENQNTNSTSSKDFEKEYNELFSISGIDPNLISHEWNGEGDSIKKFSLYDEQSDIIPTLSQNSHSQIL